MFIWSVCKQDVSSMHGIWNSRFCGRRKLPTRRKVDKIFQTFFPPRRLILYIFHKVWRLLMPKYPLGKVPLKVTSCWGSSLKIQLVVATDHQILIFFFLWHRIHSYSQKKKNSQDNLQMFLFQPTPFSICLVYTASFFFLLNILLRTVLWQFVNTPLMTKAQGK